MKYIFIIDTDSYAGNFEREMCAYLTNQIGDCEVGIEYQDDGNNITDELENIILQEPDEHGCCRPVTIDFPKNPKCNSLGIYFSAKPLYRHIEYMKERAMKFNKVYKAKSKFNIKNIKILGFRLSSLVTTYKEEKI